MQEPQNSTKKSIHGIDYMTVLQIAELHSDVRSILNTKCVCVESSHLCVGIFFGLCGPEAEDLGHRIFMAFSRSQACDSSKQVRAKQHKKWIDFNEEKGSRRVCLCRKTSLFHEYLHILAIMTNLKQLLFPILLFPLPSQTPS